MESNRADDTDGFKAGNRAGRAKVERDYDAIQREVIGAFENDLHQVLDAMTIVYARHFTAAELRDLAQFMNGPTGQKLVDKMAVIFQESMVVGQKFGEQAGQKRGRR